MAQVELNMPRMGESVAEATVIKWLVNEGDMVNADDAVLEIATDKVDSEVTATTKGRLVQKLYSEDAVVKVGDVIAIFETDEVKVEVDTPVSRNGNHYPDSQSVDASYLDKLALIPGITSGGELKPSEQIWLESEVRQLPNGDRFYSPLVRSIARSEGITRDQLDTIPGTGGEGRVTKEDVLNFLSKRPGAVKPSKTAGAAGEVWENENISEPVLVNVQQARTNPAAFVRPGSENGFGEGNSDGHGFTLKPANPGLPELKPGQLRPEEIPKLKPLAATGDADLDAYNFQEGDEILEMDRMRKLISSHMLQSKETSAHVTSFIEADVSNIVLWRNRIKDEFKRRENEAITFTPLFIEAVAQCLKELPMINVSVNGTSIIVHKHINIGMATALPTGNLIVPVLKDADQRNLAGLTRQVNDLASRARSGKLKPEEISGGTFTVTNLGTFGNIMGTPIINQPQVAILALGAIQKKPAVVETTYGDVIAIRHKMFLSLSYDHRVVDGSLGGQFLKKMADLLDVFDLNRAF